MSKEASSWPLGDMETTLRETESFIRMIGHLATSPSQVNQDEWLAIQNRLLNLHEEMDTLWRAAWKERAREVEAHQIELAAAKAHVAPGSKAEIERVTGLWSMMAAVARVALDRAAEAVPDLPALKPSGSGPQPSS